MSKRSTPTKTAPKTGTSLADNAKVQGRHRSIAASALLKSRKPGEQLTPDERATLGVK